MSALAALNAERIKLSTTRSSWWILVGVAVLSLALAALQGALAGSSAPLDPERACLGIAVFGVPVLTVFASMTVTAEYRSGTIRTTFIATPNRTTVLLMKILLMSFSSAVYACAMAVAAVAVAQAFATGAIVMSPTVPDTWRVALAVALYAALAAMLGAGVGALLRAGPGAVAVLLLWPLAVEPMLGNLPEVGPKLGPYLPFANIFIVTEVQWLYPVYAMPWGQAGSLVYFAAFALAMVGAAVVVVNLRDA
jgi:ABC-2 type transport system permease protein